MKCPKCAKEVQEGNPKCSECGHPTDSANPETTPPLSSNMSAWISPVEGATKVHRRGFFGLRAVEYILLTLGAVGTLFAWFANVSPLLRSAVYMSVLLGLFLSVVLDILKRPRSRIPSWLRLSGKGAAIALFTTGFVLKSATLDVLDPKSHRLSYSAAILDETDTEPPPTNAQKLEMIDVANRHTLRVKVPFIDKATGKLMDIVGSAVVIYKWGDLAVAATNRHVVFKNEVRAPAIFVEPRGGGAQQAWILSGEVLPAKDDLAFLVFWDVEKKTTAATFRSPGEQLRRGAPVLAIGHPKDHPWFPAYGALLGTTTIGTTPYLIHDALIEHGSSGGGLYDRHGHLVGLNTLLLGDSEGGAIDISALMSSLTIHFQGILASKLDWQRSNIPVSKDNHVWVLALGDWSYSDWYPNCDAGGTDGWPEHRVVKTAPFASLLMTVTGKGVVSVTDDSYGLPLPPGVKGLSCPVLSTGDMSFRINDTDTGARHNGTLWVVMLVRHSSDLSPK